MSFFLNKKYYRAASLAAYPGKRAAMRWRIASRVRSTGLGGGSSSSLMPSMTENGESGRGGGRGGGGGLVINTGRIWGFSEVRPNSPSSVPELG